MIIDKTYFVDKLNIPNLDLDENSDLISANSNLDNVIARYSFKYLTDAFGYFTAKQILAVIKPNGQIYSGTEQKYIDLINGKESEEWLGLRYEINNIKYSQIANFCYCQYTKEYETRLTEMGNTLDEGEKSLVVSSWSKFNASWREMMDMRQPCFGSYVDDWYYGNKVRDFKTLYDYISTSDDWDTNKFVYYENTNSLGL